MNGLIRKSLSQSINISPLKNEVEEKKNDNLEEMPNKDKILSFFSNQKNIKNPYTKTTANVNTEKGKINKFFFRQQSLRLSKTNNFPFNKNIPSSISNLRRKSINLLDKEENKINSNINTYNLNVNNMTNNNRNINSNMMNSNSNNYDELNSSTFNNKSIKIIDKNNYYQNGEVYRNKILPHKSRNFVSNLTIKDPNDFDVSEEDRMFDQFLNEKPKKNKLKKEKKKIKIKLKKKKLKPVFSYHSPLNKIYKRIPEIMDQIENTKKLKESMSLYKYQNLLLEVGSQNLNKEIRDKLNDKFVSLRKFTQKPYALFRQCLDKIENREKEIIQSINTKQDFYKKKMKEKKYRTIYISRSMDYKELPNIRFLKQNKPKFKFK
jgi:hypothetical protein